MRDNLFGIDHTCIIIRDFQNPLESFRNLGFTVSDVGLHGKEMGTGNRTITFDNDYIEFIGVVEPTDFNQPIRYMLETREGIGAIALRTNDAAAAAAELKSDGIAANGPQTVRRSVKQADGSTVEADFKITVFPETSTPYLHLFCSQTVTPRNAEALLPGAHLNTAFGIEYIGISASKPAELANDIARMLDSEPKMQGEECAVVPTGGSPIIYQTVASLGLQYPGVNLSSLAEIGPAVLCVRVRDISVAKEILVGSGVEFSIHGRDLAIPPHAACGVFLILRQIE